MIASGATHVLAYGGSRSGKTFEFCRDMIFMALVAGGRYAIFRSHFNAVKTSVFMDTIPKVLDKCFRGQRWILNRSDYYLYLPDSDAEIWALGLDDKNRVEKVLGKEFVCLYFNECSEISYHAVEVARTRLAQKNNIISNKIFYDCNPPQKTHWSHKIFIDHVDPISNVAQRNPNDYVSIKMNPEDNNKNLSNSYIDLLYSMSEDKKKRFLYGEWQDMNENALWKQSTMIDPFRAVSAPADLERIVIGVDPAVTSTETSDLTGIIIAGKKQGIDGRNHYYVLEDKSFAGSPNQWAQAVSYSFGQYRADRVVAEVNQGGDLVTTVLRQINPDLPVKTVHATRGKIVRAEPVAALYEQGLVHHVGEFPELEDEMTSYTGAESESSPDRMDALVWAITELMDDTDVMVGNFSFL